MAHFDRSPGILGLAPTRTALAAAPYRPSQHHDPRLLQLNFCLPSMETRDSRALQDDGEKGIRR